MAPFPLPDGLALVLRDVISGRAAQVSGQVRCSCDTVYKAPPRTEHVLGPGVPQGRSLHMSPGPERADPGCLPRVARPAPPVAPYGMGPEL